MEDERVRVPSLVRESKRKENMTTLTSNIIQDMDFIREMCSIISSQRKEVGIPNIQKLMSLTFYKDEEFDWLLFKQYAYIIENHCNIRYVEHELIFDGDYEKFNIKTEASLNFREAGKLFGKKTQELGKAVREGNYQKVEGGFEVAGELLHDGLISINVSVDNEENLKKDYHVRRIGDKSFIVLDTMIYSGLYMEKLAQEIIKLINSERRKADYEVGETVFPFLRLSKEYYDAFELHRELITKNAKLHDDAIVLDSGADAGLKFIEFI